MCLSFPFVDCNYDQYVCSDDFMTCASHCNGIKECNNGEDEMYCGKFLLTVSCFSFHLISK